MLVALISKTNASEPINFFFKMNKKGLELSLQTIIVMILAILVLIVLLYAFRSQIYSLFNTFGNLISDSNSSINSLQGLK